MERIRDLAVANLFSKRLQKTGVRFWLFIDLIDLTAITAPHIRFVPQVDAAAHPEEFESDGPENEVPESRRWAK
jgi:hypothetical protein